MWGGVWLTSARASTVKAPRSARLHPCRPVSPRPLATELTRRDACGVARRAGAFTIEEVAGRSAGSRVYRAHDEAGRLVALKELLFTEVPGVQELEAFEREGLVLQSLSHPGVPRFVASFREGVGVGLRLYLAQEFVPGTTLARRLESHRFSEDELLDLAAQALDVLTYLQSRVPPVFHRDVKPENLVLGADGHLSLIDFGAARERGATAGGTMVGTFGYMPHEQLGGIVDASSDVYALGATLLHLALRRPPWECEGWEQGRAVPQRLAAFLSRALAPRGLRLASASLAQEELRAARAGTLVPARKNRRVAALVATLLVVAGAAFVARGGEPGPRAVTVVGPTAGAGASLQAAVDLPRLPADDPRVVTIPAQQSHATRARLVVAGPSEAFVHVDYDYRGEAGPSVVMCAMANGPGASANQFGCSPMRVDTGRGFASLRVSLADGPAAELTSDSVRIQMWNGATGAHVADDTFALARSWHRD